MIKLGKATISLDLSIYGGDPDFIGECCWTFPEEVFSDLSDDIQVAIDDIQIAMTNGMGETHDYPLMDEFNGCDTGNADYAIALLAILAEKGGEYKIEYSGHSAFWAFHDIAHADNDGWADLDAGVCGINPIEHWQEDYANVRGAELAIKAGVSLSEIVRQIASNEKDFSERFRTESTALETILADSDILAQASVLASR